MKPRSNPAWRNSGSLSALTAALAAVGLVSTAEAQTITAGTVLVNVDATAEALGPLTNITNSALSGGYFEARGGAGTIPVIAAVNGNGTRGIRFDGNQYLQQVAVLGGPAIPADPTLTGPNPSCTIEAWVLNPGLAREETVVSWGHRGGSPDGSNMSFNYGWDARWGAVGHWGAPDIGWDACCDSDFNPLGNPQSGVWHHLVYTYDGTTQRVYSDGVLKNSENVGLNIFATPPITIAAQMADDVNVEPALRGSLTIAKLRVHSEALDGAGVLSNYTAEVSGLSNGGSLLPSGPIHRYDFSNLGGTASNGVSVVDSVGTAHGAIRGTAAFTGTRVTLPGGGSTVAPFIDLPNGLLSVNSANNGGPGAVTFEGWVKITGNRSWSRVIDFGSSDVGGGLGGEVPGVGGGGEGRDYLFLSAQEGGDVNRHVVDIRNVDPGPGTDPAGPGFDSGNFNRDYHFALSWNEATGEILVYENGSVIASMSGAGTAMSDINDVNCWLGRSNWSGDANTQGEFDEFRIYNRVVPPDQLRQNFAAGPDLVPTTNPVSVVNQPKDLTIQELQTALFTVSLDGSPPVGLQWYKNSSPVSGGTNATLTQSSVLPNQSGSQFYLVASNFVGGVPNLATSSVATLTVLGDAVPPALVQVRVIGTNQIEAIFSESIQGTDAAPANFVLTGPVGVPSITGVAIGSPSNRVVITLSGPLDCASYSLSASNIHDQSVSANVTPGTILNFFNYSVSGLTHRYTFNNPPGGATNGTVLDVVSGANGVVLSGGGATVFTGSRVTLSGGDDITGSYVDLPNGLLSVNSTNNSGSGQVTFEGWVKNTGTFSWARIFDFGSSDIGAGVGGEVTTPGGPNNNGAGLDYFMLSANSGTDTTRRRMELRNEDPGGGGVINADHTTAGFNRDTHFVVTWDERTGLIRTYENGLQVSSAVTDDPMSAIHDVNCWLGRSNWRGDDNMQGEFDEFRVYNRVLSLSDIQLNDAVGADNNFGGLLALNLAVTTNSMVTNTIATVRVLASFSGAGTQDLAAAGCVIYSSTDSNIVYITSDGVIHAVNAGTATVSASVGGQSDSEIIEVTQDATAPTLVSARGLGLRTIEITFSEPVEQGTAEEAGNYLVSSVNGAIGVIGADRLDGNQAKVVLTLDGDMPCEYMTVFVSFVADQSPLFNTIIDNSPISFFHYAPMGLKHRYTFNSASGSAVAGTVVPDAIGSANGFVRGGPAAFTGDRLVIDGGASGSAAYVELPPGLLSANAVLNGGSGQLTFEGWVKVTGAKIWGRIFDFGSSPGGVGADYFMYSASIGGDVNGRRTELRNEDPAGGGIATVDNATTGFNRLQHFVATWNESTGQIRVYEDGAQVSAMVVNDAMSDINDVNCWLGRSNWSGDEIMQGEFDEFRIYNRILQPGEIALNEAIGPDNALGQPLAVRIAMPTNTLQVGQTVTPVVTADFSMRSNVDLSLSGCYTLRSSDSSVVYGDVAGALHAVGNGTANAIVLLSGLSNSVPVTVAGGGAPPALDYISIQRNGGTNTISFHGAPDTTYRIQRTSDLTTPIAWTTISTQTTPASGLIAVQDTNPPIGQAFYRAISP